MSRTPKSYAILTMAASLLIVYLGLSNWMDSAVAFADVVEVLNNVRSATWKVTTQVKTPQNETVTWTGVGMFLAPSHERTETTAEGTNVEGQKTIQIVDGQKDKVITLVPASKTAMVMDLKNLPPERENPFGKTFLGLQELVAKARKGGAEEVERLGAETMDDRLTEGFRMKLGAVEVKIWADPLTLLPVRVETSAGPEARTVMTDFQVDIDLDESLFSLEVPPDYAVQQAGPIDFSKQPITYLAETLKMAAELNNGVFPPELRGEHGIDGILQRSAQMLAEKQGTASTDGVLKMAADLGMKLGATFGFLFSLSPEHDWHYAGKGVELNTPDRPIFWYKPQKAGTTYLVLYANLEVKEAPAEEAPKVPAPEENPEP